MKRIICTILLVLSVFAIQAQIGNFSLVVTDSLKSKDYRFKQLPNYSVYNALTNITAGDTNLATPPGNTATRPTVPSGKIVLRFNTDSNALEYGNSSGVWKTLGTSSIQSFDTSSITNFGLKVKAMFSGTSPILYNGVTGNISIQQSNSVQGGYLSQADWITFNAKLPDPGSNGILVRTALGTLASRQLVAASTNISLVNPNGVSGNPSIDINDTLLLTQLKLPYIPAAASTADSVVYLNRTTNLLEIRPVLSGSGSVILNNVGLGNRMVKTSTGNIATVFAGYGTLIDSTSNANGLTWEADTSSVNGLVTQSDLAQLTGDNGITRNVNSFELGGTLKQNTTINTTSSYFINVTGANVGQSFKGTNTTTGTGVMGQSASGTGVYGLSSSLNGVLGVSTSGTGVVGESTSGEAINANLIPSSTNTLAPVVRIQRFSTGTAANGIGGSLDWYTQSTGGSTQRSNRIGSSWSNATTGSRTSILEFYGVNSATEARKAALAGTGQWTWDGYPALTAQTDTTTYKPVAIDGSGNVVKMDGWAVSGGGGGSATLTYKNVGYGGIGNTLSTGEATFQYDSIINELTVDSTSAIQHRANYFTLNPISKVDSADGFGDSFMNREVTTSNDSAFLDRTAASFDVPAKEHAVSGSGIYYATALELRTMVPNHNGITMFMSGFNTIRNNNILNGLSGRKTQNAIIQGFKSAFASHFLKSYIGASDGTITRFGSWTTNLNVYNVGGKTTTAAYTSTVNDSLTYSFTDSTVIVGLIGQNDLNQAGSSYTIYIDGSPVRSATTSNQADGVEDGFGTSGNYIAVAEIFTGLTYSTHSIKVVNTGTGVFIADYIGHLRPVTTAPSIVMYNIPYMKEPGYAIAPANSNPERTDTMNVRLDSLYAALPNSYKSKAFMVQTNNFYDTTTGCYTDDVHPNDLGHRQIWAGTMASFNSITYPEGTYYYGAGYPYFKDAIGDYKVILGEANSGHLLVSSGVNKVENSIVQDDGTNVGIGQTPGTYKLSVSGTLRATQDAYFATSSGNVGVGTTAPDFKFHVTGGHIGVDGSLFSRGSLAGISWQSRVAGGDGYGWSFYSTDTMSTQLFSGRTVKDRVKFWNYGGMTITNRDEASPPYAGYTLDVHGSVRIDKDSVQQVASVTSETVVLLDTISGKVKRISASAFGGSDGNGIYGGSGSLPSPTVITQAGNTLDFNSVINSDAAISINNTGTSGTGLYSFGTTYGVNALSDGVGVTSFGAGQGGYFEGSTGEGAIIKSNAIRSILAQSVPNSTNTVQEVIRVERGSTGGAGGDGIGGSINFYNKVSDNTSRETNTIVSKFTNATVGSRTSQLTITGVNSGSNATLLTLDGDGSLTTTGKRIVSVITSSAGSLTIGNAETYIFNGTTTTWTLPAVSGTTGYKYHIKNIGSGTITLNANAGGNEIYSTTAVSTLAILAGASVTLISNGTYFTVID
jgi:hypothetical protein